MAARQRLIYLAIAVVLAVVAVVLLTTGGPDEAGEQTVSTPTATPASGSAEEEATPEATATPAATPRPRPRLPLLVQGNPRTLRFTEGERIAFRVRARQADHVHVHGFDRLKDVAAGQTVTFSFPADITGIYEVELEDAGILLGNLRIDPD
jgi:hypothetical protein